MISKITPSSPCVYILYNIIGIRRLGSSRGLSFIQDELIFLAHSTDIESFTVSNAESPLLFLSIFTLNIGTCDVMIV